MPQKIKLPLSLADALALRAGDAVTLNGVLYTARDAAHKRMIGDLQAGRSLPFPVEGATLYYVGPTPPPPNGVIGSAGPTTSSRMDAYTPALLAQGLRGMIGKGRRSATVVEAMRRYSAVYFGAVGGAGALLASHIKSCEVVAFPELGPEAVYRLEVVDFPLFVVIDSQGNDLYESGPAAYRAAHEK